MKKFAEKSLWLMLFIACSIGVQGQEFKVEGHKPASLSDSPNSPSFTSLDGRFVISLPEKAS
jgi:hypothetical protein